MAVKQVELRNMIRSKKRELRKAQKREADLQAQIEALEEKEDELEEKIEELDESVDEEIQELIQELEEEIEEITEEKEEAKKELEEVIELIEEVKEDLEELEEDQKDVDERNARRTTARKTTVRKIEVMDEKRRKFFKGEMRSKAGIVQTSEVRSFLANVRRLKGQRAVTGADLMIPNVLLDLMRDTLYEYSQLIDKVNKVPVPGKARQTVAGGIPEAVWTEACADLNELAVSFTQVEVDGYKVGGFIPICNALLEDADIDLADEIMYNLAQAIGYAVDKAILYGSGTKMPVGIVTRLAEESQPNYWTAAMGTWTDLHSTNIKTINPSGMSAETFYSTLIGHLGIARPNQSSPQGAFAAMNRKTFAALQGKALNFAATGAIVSGQERTMPIIGGDIVLLEFIPDNDIVYGYGQLYLLAERAEALFGVSEHAMFIQDQTVFKGTARYDGKPVVGEGFVVVNIANSTPTKTRTFASDSANP